MYWVEVDVQKQGMKQFISYAKPSAKYMELC